MGGQAMAYAGYPAHGAHTQERPVTVTVLAVLGIVVGALGLVSLPMNLLYIATGWRAAGPMGPAIWANHTFRTYMLVSLPISTVVGVLCIVAGVGMLRLRAWARKLAIGLIVFELISQIAGAFIMGPQVTSIFTDAMQSMPAMPPGAPDLSFMKPALIGAVVTGTLVATAVMTVLLVLLTRPHVKEALASREPA
jgi:hypothetical protein